MFLYMLKNSMMSAPQIVCHLQWPDCEFFWLRFYLARSLVDSWYIGVEGFVQRY